MRRVASREAPVPRPGEPGSHASIVTRLLNPDTLVGAGSVNVVLQGLTLVSKALLLLGLARYLEPADFGVFGIFAVTLGLSMYLIGLDFHAYNMREIIGGNPEEIPRLVRDQFVFHGITYLLVSPLLLLIFAWGVLAWSLAAFFFALLVLEHIAQEIQRLLITLHRSVQAAVLLFIRGGLWAYPLLWLMAQNPAARTVQVVAIAWLSGVACSLVAGGFWLRQLPWHSAAGIPVDWAWLRRGVLISLPFLAASLALRGMFSIDRYALQSFWGAEHVGVYTFYASIRNAIQSVLDLGVMAVITPRLIGAYHDGRTREYHSLLQQLRVGVGGIVVGLCVVAGIAVFPLLSVIQRPLYGQHLGAYWTMLGVTLVAALGDIPHAQLYARHQDRAIVLSALGGLLAAGLLNVVLVPKHGIGGAAAATLLACTVTAGVRIWFLRRGRFR